MKHLILFNSRHASLPGVKDVKDAFLAQRHQNLFVQEWPKLRSGGWKSHSREFTTATLFGNFEELDSNLNATGRGVDRELFDYWIKLGCIRIWNILPLDCHVGVQRMLAGKKYKPSLEQSIYIDAILKSIDVLAWPYEHLEATNNPQRGENACPDTESQVLMNFETLTFLRTRFSKRIDFPWTTPYVKKTRKCPIKVRYDICVPGQMYESRRASISKFNNLGFRLAPYDRFDRFIRVCFYVLSKFPFPQNVQHGFQSGLRTKLRLANMKFFMRSSRFTFVDGGLLNYPVRKYFEAASIARRLLCQDQPFLDAYGFTGGQLKYEFDDMASRRDYVLSLYKNPPLNLEAIHSPSSRVLQFIETLKFISFGRFTNGTFVKGQYRIFKIPE